MNQFNSNLSNSNPDHSIFLSSDHPISDTEAEDQTYDDYDWNNDDDLDGDVKFADLHELKPTSKHHPRKSFARRFSPYKIFKFLLITFIGNIFLSIILLIPPFILRFRGFYQFGDSPHQIHTRYIYDNVAAWMFWASYNLLASWVLHLLIELVPRLLVFLVDVIWGEVSEVIKTYVENFRMFKPWIKYMFYSAMLWGSWEIIFSGLYQLHSHDDSGQYRAPYTDVVSLVIRLFFLFMVVLSLEKLLLLSISMRFHRVAYADRIQKLAQALTVIDTLQEYRPKRKSLPPFNTRKSGEVITMKNLQSRLVNSSKKPSQPSETKSSLNNQTKLKWWQKLHGKNHNVDLEKAGQVETSISNSKNPSPPNSTTIIPPTIDEQNESFNDEKSSQIKLSNPTPKLSRKNSLTTFATLAQRGSSAAKIAQAAMKDPVSVLGKKSGLRLDVNNPTEAKKLARKIYFSLKTDPNRTYLIPSDFFPAFPTHDSARDAFSIFDTDGNGDISRTEIKNEIFRVYKERRALTQSLQDVGDAISRLDGLMMVIAAIVFLFITLSVVGIDYSKALTSVYTVGIAAAFIFKETAGNVFDAIVMVFCTHPFDTGDRIILDNEGVEEILVVKRMGLLATVFCRWDGTEWFAPNSLLGQKAIINLRRSTNQFENATVQFGWDTPLEKIDELEEKMNVWLETDEQRRFEPGTACVIQKLVNQEYMEITLGMIHRENWQDWGARWNRRTAFHAAINYYSRQLGIKFYKSEQPVELLNWKGMKDTLLNDHFPFYEEKPHHNDVSEDDDEFEIECAKDILNSPQPKSSQRPYQHDQSKSENILPNPTIAESLGFSAPPNDGIGLRRRKRMSKKKAMMGDA
ncbi:hypothetical protein O181_082153 [Austropuccinia psidii MF-1]|uniref:EF-hand domain-containing protein n=1 Tax=Austropuccinia psidii MF-1 TaxID=1389203 RepID=A0A9Q3II73_9BASI|nr:hypothetical protein [Austropuccinia psidii MF-1]